MKRTRVVCISGLSTNGHKGKDLLSDAMRQSGGLRKLKKSPVRCSESTCAKSHEFVRNSKSRKNCYVRKSWKSYLSSLSTVSEECETSLLKLICSIPHRQSGKWTHK